ncbi:MAG: hypothetical protein AAB536_03605 [Patescibacteria group bacterium]
MNQKLSQLQIAAGVALIGVTYNNGIKGYVDPATIPHDKWTPFHGETLNGVKVNSPRAALIPESSTVAIEDNGYFFGISAASFEVMSVGAAKNLGYKVEPATPLRAAA